MPDAEAVRTRQGGLTSALAGLAAGLVVGTGCRAAESMPPLPVPVTNNAVVVVPTRDSYEVITALGLGPGKTWRDTLSAAWRWTPGSDRWVRLPDLPGPGGRLAAAAAAVGGHAHVFGGYTVAEDGSEVSAPDVLRLEPDGEWSAVALMPVPVDDAVALPWKDRYVYLVSGWHDLGNVNLVQLYDARTDRWSQATPWPGEPVFGHAGGIVGDVMVVCDGVRLAVSPRRFETVRQCFLGAPDAGDPRRIAWSAMPHHGGQALYRAAAVGSAGLEMIIFAGGSEVAYNFDGIGYDSRPATPSPRIFAWRVAEARWEDLGRNPHPTMDHRGLLETPDGFFVIGGLDAERRVLSGVTRVPVTAGPRD